MVEEYTRARPDQTRQEAPTLSPAAPLLPSRHIAFLLGKPPKASSLFPELFRLLEADGLRVSVGLPHQEAPSRTPA